MNQEEKRGGHASDSAGLRFAVPPGACDSHVHFYGPPDRYPVEHDAKYQVPSATPEEFITLQQSVGLSRAVVVHAIATGRDNRRTLDALREHSGRFRGIVTPPIEAPSDASLLEWDRLGVRGIRFSYVGSPPPGMAIDDTLIRRVAEFGWHAQVHVAGDRIVGLVDRLLELPCKVVIDHMARIPAKWGTGSEAFQCLLRLVDSGKVWVKLSAPMRYSSEGGPPYSDVKPMAVALLERAPERVLWASDWPNVNHAGTIPNYAKLLDLLYDWAPNERRRNCILVDNPCEVYAFAPLAETTN